MLLALAHCASSFGKVMGKTDYSEDLGVSYWKNILYMKCKTEEDD